MSKKSIVIAMCATGLALGGYYAWDQEAQKTAAADSSLETPWEAAEQERLLAALNTAKELTPSSSYEEVQNACVKVTVSYLGQDQRLRALKTEAEIYVDRMLTASREIVVKADKISEIRRENEPKIQAAKTELLRIASQVAILVGQS